MESSKPLPVLCRLLALKRRDVLAKVRFAPKAGIPESRLLTQTGRNSTPPRASVAGPLQSEKLEMAAQKEVAAQVFSAKRYWPDG